MYTTLDKSYLLGAKTVKPVFIDVLGFYENAAILGCAATDIHIFVLGIYFLQIKVDSVQVTWYVFYLVLRLVELPVTSAMLFHFLLMSR